MTPSPSPYLFISYSRSDRHWVDALVKVLKAEGLPVWSDSLIPAGQAYQDVIEHALRGARGVIVVWSKESVQSQWVRAEAEEARKRGILVPITIEAVSPPLVFRQIQTIDLGGWDRESAPPLRRLLADLANLLENEAAAAGAALSLTSEAGQPATAAFQSAPGGLLRSYSLLSLQARLGLFFAAVGVPMWFLLLVAYTLMESLLKPLSFFFTVGFALNLIGFGMAIAGLRASRDMGPIHWVALLLNAGEAVGAAIFLFG